ncbi:hypothetical protein NEMIN01_2201 [Nematocida minor]|uniref:uncharacterized protein n=1 Tax=Nematocida minor TaxID=1912983 RepID=UPI002220E120|nr:uncharacterized protein NEMIN01_2201 [Nematocida minor]KAI5192756.1 hypothetical protein NEMIN01_2201 [Nematocida minor]
MKIECKLLSYSTESLTQSKNGVWWWEGAPVFTSEHTIRIWNNGQKVEFSPKTASFVLNIESIHDIKMGILEIFILSEGLIQNELVGYAFKRVEDLLQKKKNSVHYLKILPVNDPISGWLYTKQPHSDSFRPKEMEFYLALSVTIHRTINIMEKKKIPFLWAGFLKNEAVAGRIFDLQQAFLFLFRDMHNISEFVYGIRELFLYYNQRDALEFKNVPLYEFAEKKSGFMESIRRRIFGRKESTHERRVFYSLYLKEALKKTNPFMWHVETEDFYQNHLKNYRYAISPYGHAFLNLHSLLNVIKNKIEHCECLQCASPKIKQEEKFFHLFSGIPYEDILHDDSKYLEYVIFIEKAENCLYIAFKGTLHSREALIDIDYKYYKYKGNLFHQGMFKESEKFFKEKEQKILHLMKSNNLSRIRLVGQSLGGALSMLVWMFMRESPFLSQYKIACIAYSPPPIINNPGWFKKLIDKKTENTVTAVIYGNDIVPTLCLGKVFELRLLATHFYAISVSKYKNKNKYIHAILRKMKKKGMAKLFIPGDIYKIRHTTTSPSTFLVRRTHWSEYSSIKLWTKAFIHHTPGAMINALQKSIKYFYTEPSQEKELSDDLDNNNMGSLHSQAPSDKAEKSRCNPL